MTTRRHAAIVSATAAAARACTSVHDIVAACFHGFAGREVHGLREVDLGDSQAVLPTEDFDDTRVSSQSLVDSTARLSPNSTSLRP